jgi:hypothetical protein
VAHPVRLSGLPLKVPLSVLLSTILLRGLAGKVKSNSPHFELISAETMTGGRFSRGKH